MKKIIKYFGLSLLFVIVIIAVFGVVLNESLPEGEKTAKADVLAQKMLKALNNKAFKETRFIEWSFRGNHYYKWDKQNHHVMVSWNGNKVHLFTKEITKSKVLQNSDNKSSEELINNAKDYFNNDSFWLIAPYKVFDAAVERSIVYQDNGEESLMVTYKSGGTTPGDSYLWFLDGDGMPKYYKMWVSILPVGGVKAGWAHWKKTSTGAMLPTEHKLIGTISMGDVKAYNK